MSRIITAHDLQARHAAGESMTDLANELGITRERVRQLIERPCCNGSHLCNRNIVPVRSA